MKRPSKLAAIDTETTGLNPYSPHTQPILNTYYDSRDREAIYRIPDEEPKAVLAACKSHQVTKLFWNASYDIPILEKQGVKTEGPIICCMMMAQMGFPEERLHSLKHFSRKYLEDPYEEEVALRNFMRKNKINRKKRGFLDVPDRILHPYGMKDARNTYLLFDLLADRFDEHNLWPHLEVEMRLLRDSVLPMQERGILIDEEEARRLLKEGEQELVELKRRLCDLAGNDDFNPNSPIQVAAAIYNDETEVEVTRYTKAFNPATDELALLELSTNPMVRELCLGLMHFRKLSKAAGTYLKNVLKAKDADNVFRVSFNQTRARTGRFSSSGYDVKGQLQNTPRPTNAGVLGSIRSIFVARPGYRIVCIDLDQVELRIQAHFLQDGGMIKAIREGEDLHNLACERYLHKDPTPVYRYAAKTLNYAGTYGAGATQFQDTVYKESGGKVSIDYETASTAIENFREVTAPLSEMVLEEVSMSGGTYDFYGKWIGVDSGKVYAGVNYKVQGTAAGYLKRCMFKVADILEGKKSGVLLQAHDELVFEIHKSEKYLVPELKAAMEDQETFLVPITASASWGKAWGKKKELRIS